MKTFIRSVCLVALVAVPYSPLSAQWPVFPSPGVPKTADGQPNLDGPPPRTADGKPDFSGIWENRFGGFPPAAAGGGRRGAPPAPGAPPGATVAPAPAAVPTPPAAPPRPVLPADGTPPVATFFNVGAGFPDGLPFQPWAAELVKKRRADNDKDNPDAHCLPMGFMQLHEHVQPRKIVQTPKEMIIMYEGNYGLREIFMDGRPLPANDPQPWWYGYSIGKWEGDTLVVQTVGMRDGGWLDIWGSPFTDAAKITERFRRPTFGKLEIDVTIDDAKAYTKPFTVRVNHRILLDSEMIEFICLENERSSPHYEK
jgi:hypothetical protein